MRHVMKHFAVWDIVLIIGVAAIVIFIAASVSPSATAEVGSRHANLVQTTAIADKAGNARYISTSKPAASHSAARPQDDYYDARRRYWEDRVDRRIEREDLDDEDKADSTDKKDKAGKGDDDEDSLDQEEELIERRREYWRRRVDDEW